MAYDPTKPANSAPVSSSELRNQFAGLKELIDEKANTADLVPTIDANSSGPIAGQVDYFTGTFSDPPTAAEVQALADKVNDLITVLKRT